MKIIKSVLNVFNLLLDQYIPNILTHFLVLLFFLILIPLEFFLIVIIVYLSLIILFHNLKLNFIGFIFRKVNPFYTTFKETWNRKSNDRIFNAFDNLSEHEQKINNKLISIANKTLNFDSLEETHEFDYVYQRYKNGISNKQIERLILKVCEYLKLNTKFIETLVFSLDYNLEGKLGYFLPKKNIGGEIGVSISSLYDIRIILSIIIHECIHYYMHVNNVNIENAYEEYFTDFLALYLGLGNYLIEGYKQIDMIDENFLSGFKKFALGYLSDRQLIKLQETLKNKTNNNIWDNF